MGNKTFETIMGAVVLIIAIAFMMFAYQSSNLKTIKGYPIKAKFTSVSGIGIGTDVRIAGIKVGVVTDLALEPDTYRAIVTFQIKDEIKLPVDSGAAIGSDGLLGSKYMKIEPGADDKMLASGETITITQSSVNLEDMISKFIGVGGDKKPSKTEAGSAQPLKENEKSITVK